MPEITEEMLQSWARLSDYSDSHGALEACVALDEAIAEIRRLREALTTAASEKAALVGMLLSTKHGIRQHTIGIGRAERLESPPCTGTANALNKLAERVEKFLALTPSAAAEQWEEMVKAAVKRSEWGCCMAHITPCTFEIVGLVDGREGFVDCQCGAVGLSRALAKIGVTNDVK